MSGILKFHVNVTSESLNEKLSALCQDDTAMLQIHNLLAQMCDPYVPMQTGTLAQTLEVTPRSVRYTSPYAHYQYMGEVYGPNIPIIEDGVVVGWFSPPKKYPTGRPISYSGEQHPLATSHWDKAMMRDRGDEFKERVTDILKRRAKELW